MSKFSDVDIHLAQIDIILKELGQNKENKSIFENYKKNSQNNI